MAVPLEMCLDGEDRRWQHSSLGWWGGGAALTALDVGKTPPWIGPLKGTRWRRPRPMPTNRPCPFETQTPYLH
jgi:hypothetical protein